MNLLDYAIVQGGTGKRGCPVLTHIASVAACSADTLYMIARGHKRAGYALALAVERATSGGVGKHEMRPDIYSRAARVD